MIRSKILPDLGLSRKVVFTASAAENLRSRRGSVCWVPAGSSQRCSVAPQGGEGTDSIRFFVSSLIFIAIYCNISQRKNAQYCSSSIAHLDALFDVASKALEDWVYYFSVCL
jgi:hypothetical protein